MRADKFLDQGTYHATVKCSGQTLAVRYFQWLPSHLIGQSIYRQRLLFQSQQSLESSRTIQMNLVQEYIGQNLMPAGLTRIGKLRPPDNTD